MKNLDFVAAGIRFIYLESNLSGRKITVAYLYDDENKCIRYAVAECSHRDRFVKDIGRRVAAGRLLSYGGDAVSFDEIGGSGYRLIIDWFKFAYS